MHPILELAKEEGSELRIQESIQNLLDRTILNVLWKTYMRRFVEPINYDDMAESLRQSLEKEFSLINEKEITPITEEQMQKLASLNKGAISAYFKNLKE